MTASKIRSPLDVLEALRDSFLEQLYGRTPEYDRLGQRQDELVQALSERLDDDGRRTLDALDDLFGEIADEAKTRGFLFGYDLGVNGIRGIVNGDGS